MTKTGGKPLSGGRLWSDLPCGGGRRRSRRRHGGVQRLLGECHGANFCVALTDNRLKQFVSDHAIK